MNYGRTRREMERKYKYDIYVFTDSESSNCYIPKEPAWTKTKEESKSEVIHVRDSCTLYEMFSSTEKLARYRALVNLRVVLEKEWKTTQYSEIDGQYYMFGQPPVRQGDMK